MVSHVASEVYKYGKTVVPVGAISYGIAKYVAFNPATAPAGLCAISMLFATVAAYVFPRDVTLKSIKDRLGILFNDSLTLTHTYFLFRSTSLIYKISTKQALVSYGIYSIAYMIFSQIDLLYSNLQVKNIKTSENAPAQTQGKNIKASENTPTEGNGGFRHPITIVFSYAIGYVLGFPPLAMVTFSIAVIGLELLGKKIKQSLTSQKSLAFFSHYRVIIVFGGFAITSLTHHLPLEQLIPALSVYILANSSSVVSLGLLSRCFEKKADLQKTTVSANTQTPTLSPKRPEVTTKRQSLSKTVK